MRKESSKIIIEVIPRAIPGSDSFAVCIDRDEKTRYIMGGSFQALNMITRETKSMTQEDFEFVKARLTDGTEVVFDEYDPNTGKSPDTPKNRERYKRFVTTFDKHWGNFVNNGRPTFGINLTSKSYTPEKQQIGLLKRILFNLS